MSARRLLARALCLGLSLGLGLGGCVHAKDRAEGYGSGPPATWAEVEKVPVHGFWVWLRFHDRDKLVGELLFAEPGFEVAVQTKEGIVETRAWSELRRATVQTDPKAKVWLASMGLVTAVLVPLGVVTGALAVIVVPATGVLGSVAMGITWAESRVILKGEDLNLLYQYARWPQGSPERTIANDPVGTPLQPEPEPAAKPAPPPAAPIEPVPFR
ncbi:hypothetical protein PPSIR1_17050 [Plesiocystis pacifica SIR-1]|uniref:Lipoprotein n=1 Tax=Plesiocystis pacifica SIR-1 TaxID=391625 RepID=A6GGK3_9BACT|nr:hypothetical protein [Plesiocystis pacifica]EDM75029.1 hypothetical protein PPSIR1_17050 [Plesiocystis pacifica SIR-1]